MILQALKGYYEREKARDNLPVFGYEVGNIHFELVLNLDGELVQVNDLREPREKGKPRPKRMMVPSLLTKRTSGVEPLFTWDKTDYVLGASNKGKEKRIQQCHDAFKELHHSLGDEMELPLMQAVLKFLDAWDPTQIAEVINDRAVGNLDWEEVAGSNLVFRLDGERDYLQDKPEIQKAWQTKVRERIESVPGFCLVNGKAGAIARLHPAIKNVQGAQTSGASLISFNKDKTAFTSFAKESNFNAPVSVEAAFEYATSLNSLLSNYERRVRIGDATTVFWTEKPSEAEGILASAFTDTAGDTGILEKYLTVASRGNQPRGLDLDVPFYVLGLSPNSARISVRFWYASTVGEISERLGQHFEDLRIERRFDFEPRYPSMWQLVNQTALFSKKKNKRDPDRIPPSLAGEFSRSVLEGRPYPRSLYAAIIGRIRAEAADSDLPLKEQGVNYLQAALIKGYLVRINKQPEVTMSLDNDNNSTAYLIGRLFAICEGAQKAALGNNINRTIKDSYISSASATPGSVFPRLLSLVQHHIKKAGKENYGGRYDKLIEKVMDKIGEFPAHLKLEDQGVFFLGYYHQRNDLYRKDDTEDKN